MTETTVLLFRFLVLSGRSAQADIHNWALEPRLEYECAQARRSTPGPAAKPVGTTGGRALVTDGDGSRAAAAARQNIETSEAGDEPTPGGKRPQSIACLPTCRVIGDPGETLSADNIG